MKRTASKILQNQGYKTYEERDSESKLVDLVAENSDRKIAIEVGNLSSEGKERLQQEFDELIHIPYQESSFERKRLDSGPRTHINSRVDPKIKEYLDRENVNKSALIENLLKIWIEAEKGGKDE